MTTSFDLSLAAVDVLARGIGVDCRVFPFTVPGVGRDPAERARIIHAVAADLHHRGLAHNGDPAPEVLRAIRLLAKPDQSIAVLSTTGLLARATAGRTRASLVVQTPAGLRFTLMRPTELIRAMTALLPPLGPGPGRSVTIARPDPHPPTHTQPVRRPRDPNLHAAEEIMRRPRTGEGYFMSHENGRVRTLSWLDTDRGRYLTWSSPDRHHTTLVPADTTRLRTKLAELTGSP